MSKKKSELNLDEISFEEALERLEKIVEKLGNQKINLEEMVGLYEQALALKEHCSRKISDAKLKIELVGKE